MAGGHDYELNTIASLDRWSHEEGCSYAQVTRVALAPVDPEGGTL